MLQVTCSVITVHKYVHDIMSLDPDETLVFSRLFLDNALMRPLMTTVITVFLTS